MYEVYKISAFYFVGTGLFPSWNYSTFKTLAMKSISVVMNLVTHKSTRCLKSSRTWGVTGYGLHDRDSILNRDMY